MDKNILILLQNDKDLVSSSCKKLINKISSEFVNSKINGVIFSSRSKLNETNKAFKELSMNTINIINIKKEHKDNFNIYIKYLHEYIKDNHISLIFALEDNDINQYIPKIAGKFNGEIISNSVDIINNENNIKVIKEIDYGINTIECLLKAKGLKIITFSRLNFNESYNIEIKCDSKIITEDFCSEVEYCSKIIKENINSSESEENINKSRVVVGIGRAFDSENKVNLAREFAKNIGATIGATRPVVDNNLIDYSCQIGQTGKVINPELYIALGVSGSPQHMMGAIKSKKIIAINKDQDAEILKFCDYGFVGDVFSLLEKINEAFMKK